MGIEIRVPDDDQWPAVAHADGRAFGFTYTAEMLDDRRPTIDLSRFRVAVDGKQVVGIVGSFGFEVTVPGGATLPMGGVTWVSAAATHRRQGIVRRLMDEVHADLDARGDVLANLTASEGSIYERFGYGIASHFHITQIPTRVAEMREEVRPQPGAVRFIEEDEARVELPRIWDRFRRLRAGEVSRSPELTELFLKIRSRPDDGASAAFHLLHADGYATYRVADEWNDGWPNHELRLIELAAVTPDAHAALWHTLLNVDLVATIKTRAFPEDDPLPYLLTNYRAVRTVGLTDGLWVNVRNPKVCLEARRYATADQLVVELSDGDAPSRRYSVEGGPDGAACRSVRTKPDLTMTTATLGALLYGGVRPSRLAAGRKLEARSDDLLRRADLFFPMAPLPYCQTPY